MLTICDKETKGFFVMFPFFSEEEKAHIIRNTHSAIYKKGATIFSEGEMPGGLVYLSSGKAKICKKGILGKEQIIRLIQSCQLLGFRALCAGEPYGASTQALEASLVCTIEKECFLSLMKTNISFALAMLQHASRVLGYADLRTVALLQKHLRARLADSLLLLASTYGMEDDYQTLCGRFSRSDLANLANMTTPNAIRTLSTFQDEGLVSINRYNIRLLNIPAICRISSHG
ncbi:MAG: Crp/Fnr family transcriptional regulator [Prevotellaceae bacterium]|jgi:CRP-like cAMP-binding protein|nr:Crp/Fnr family transcriptional regulator [Prevotellaceae bacterium]